VTQEPFGDIPLFREIQRLLQAGGGGPINNEIARQVATAVALGGQTEPAPLPEESHDYSQIVYGAESVLAGYTRLDVGEPLRTQVVTRTWWIGSTLEAWHWLLEGLAGRFTGEMSKLGPEAPEGGENPLGAMMGQVAPLMMGLQIGSLLGQLAKEQLGRYDLPIPRDDDGQLFLVAPNADSLAADYELEPDAIKGWLGLNEAARGLVEKRVTWVGRYFRSLLTEMVASIEIDAEGLERRLMDLQSQGIESLQGSTGMDDILPIVPSERHNQALRRVRAFVALFEGYARHACAQVADQVVKDYPRLEEVMARRAAEPSDGESMLTNLLGLSLDRALEQSGVTFCAAIVSLKGLATLNRVWDAPDNVPTVEEIKDPFAWLERVSIE
jgi:putative hydrolase